MNDIYQEIQAADFKTALEEYFAHCDLFRQQIGNASDKSKKEVRFFVFYQWIHSAIILIYLFYSWSLKS